MIIRSLNVIVVALKYFPFADIQFLPISGLHGTNMQTRVEKSVCPWFDGQCLFESLDAIEVPLRDPNGPFRYLL